MPDDQKRIERIKRKFWLDRGPVSDETKEKLRQKMREFHKKTGKGTQLGNALARKARLAKKKLAWLPLWWMSWQTDALGDIWWCVWCG